MSEENKRLEDELAEDRPVYLLALNVFLMICFAVYDAVVYLPFKLFADPKHKLELSERVKVRYLLDYNSNVFRLNLLVMILQTAGNMWTVCAWAS
jgi:hypothetical protein